MKIRLTFLLTFTITILAAQNSLPIYKFVRTTGKLPSLAYSQGEDRLGNAKMGYLDSNIVLKVIDSTDNMYKVQLSKYHTAFIEKIATKPDSIFKEKAFHLVNTLNVKSWPDSTYDMLTIAMDEKLPYKNCMEINPSKLKLQLYGVQSNTNWIMQLSNVKAVKDVYFEQLEDDVVNIIIDLKHQQNWGYSIAYNGRALIVKIKHQPKELKLQGLKIGIDAGHGGTNLGGGGTGKNLEKTFTLQFAEALKEQLEKDGALVIMTRIADSTILNSDRVIYLQKENPDLLISLHLNSSSNKTIQGISTYYKHIGFKRLSTTLLEHLLDGTDLKEYGNIGNFNLSLLAPTEFPNALIELGFLSNAEDELKLTDAKFQKIIAKKIKEALEDFLKQAN